MKLIIDIDDKVYGLLKYFEKGLRLDDKDDIDVKTALMRAVLNGTLLDTHDEEIIATTVESIWGKPPYIEMLDKLRAEIDQTQYDYMSDGDYDEGVRFGLMLAYQIIDRYRNEVSE